MIDSLRLGTRGSELARWQTQYVMDLLQAAHPHLRLAMQIIATQGDRALDTPLPLVGGKGVFTAELETALRAGTIDLAVHSLKDLPTESPQGLVVGAVPVRANPADVLVSQHHYTLETLPRGAMIGTSSHRRAAQLLHQRPDLKMIDIRGNVDTRIRKALDPDSPYAAIVLAHAGLERLGRLSVISEVLTFDQMLPAPGQAALGVQCRDDAALCALLAAIQHPETLLAVTAERAFLAGLGGGCSVPIAAYAHVDESGKWQLQGRVCSLEGATQIDVSAVIDPPVESSAVRTGMQLAQTALDQGAATLLESTS